MIASVSGKLKNKNERFCILEVLSVGFKVFISSATFEGLPRVGENCELLTRLYFREREGVFELFGFGSKEELSLFELLLDVQGVGPRGALSILSQASVDELDKAISANDEKLLMRVSGIGRKKAQKILLELQEKYSGIGVAADGTLEVLDALRSLGYSEKEAREALRLLPKDVLGVESRIKEALRILGKKS